MNEKVISEVVYCARCGEYHKKIIFRSFKRSMKKHTHWAMCPNTKEPILMYIKEPTIWEWVKYSFEVIWYKLQKIF